MTDRNNVEIEFPEVDLTGIQGVLLDLDDTLYSYDRCHDYALLKAHAHINGHLNLDCDEFLKEYSKARARVNTELKGQGSSHSRLLYFQKLLESVAGKTNFSLSISSEEVYWRSFFEKMELLTDARYFLEKCKNKHIPICIVTDLTAKIQMEKIVKLGIADYIDFLVSSEEAGVEKPHPYIFKLAVEKLGIDNDKLIMIGDNINRDVLGARLLNIKSIHISKK